MKLDHLRSSSGSTPYYLCDLGQIKPLVPRRVGDKDENELITVSGSEEDQNNCEL